MSNIKSQIEADYAGYWDEELHTPEWEQRKELAVEFELYDDDTYWLTNDMKETSK